MQDMTNRCSITGKVSFINVIEKTESQNPTLDVRVVVQTNYGNLPVNIRQWKYKNPASEMIDNPGFYYCKEQVDKIKTIQQCGVDEASTVSFFNDGKYKSCSLEHFYRIGEEVVDRVVIKSNPYAFIINKDKRSPESTFRIDCILEDFIDRGSYAILKVSNYGYKGRKNFFSLFIKDESFYYPALNYWEEGVWKPGCFLETSGLIKQEKSEIEKEKKQSYGGFGTMVEKRTVSNIVLEMTSVRLVENYFESEVPF